MLQYEKIGASEGIDVNKTSVSEECELCHYWFFKDVGFKSEGHVCNGCHDLLTMAYALEKIAILGAKGATFGGFRKIKQFCFRRKRCLINGFSCK